ncbi:MAG: DUF4832 domain-containing protein [Lachnospiraceae bacterium]|nr:DUF4832 domain-containing protein [Lachnospiraceae bacterium]
MRTMISYATISDRIHRGYTGWEYADILFCDSAGKRIRGTGTVNMVKTKRMTLTILIPMLVAVFCLTCIFMSVYVFFKQRAHGGVRSESFEFTESNMQLINPNRGFYFMHGFTISDEGTDYEKEFEWRFSEDTETALSMIEINLQEYTDGSISEAGLRDVGELLDAMESVDKHYIVRPLYDWNGENESVEPESIDIILEHMRQLGELFSQHKDIIFTLQGLFIGNWGEMNQTAYLGSGQLKQLAYTLSESTDDEIFLAVRMPMQWRMITGMADAGEVNAHDGSLASRLGLFNDGMLGSYSDYGTYGEHTKEEDGYMTYWNREEELEFQEILCSMVPIGGEVINDNIYNDFENAVSDMKRMHVTYINGAYDKEVFDKWAETTVSESGCFDGMDGLSYIERHLGYRLLINDTSMSYDFMKDELTITVNMRNVGFAPVYRASDVRIILRDEESGRSLLYELPQDIRELAGGNEADETEEFSTVIQLKGEQKCHFDVYFEITDSITGERLLLANEQGPSAYGYCIGSIDIEGIEELFDGN